MAPPGSDAQALERLREERALLARRLRRRTDALQFLQLMTKTFVSLTLDDKVEICDTLNALILTFLEARVGAILLRSEDGGLKVAGCQGASAAELTGPGARAAVGTLLGERVAQYVDGARARSLWPDSPAPLREGFACCAIEIQDAAVGLVIAADRSSGEAVLAEDLDFLASAAGLGGMAIRNAELLVSQKALTRDVELRAQQSRREAAERQRTVEELDRRLAIIEEQRSAIRELSAPILEVWDDVLALPIIGALDGDRGEEIMHRVLTEASARRAKFVIVDVTGVEEVDATTASYLHRLVRSATLLGTSCMLTGMRPAVAQALVALGVDMSSLTTLRNLREGLAECMRRKRRRGI